MPRASRRSNRRSAARAAPAAAGTSALIVPIEDDTVSDSQRASASTSGDAAQKTVALPRELRPFPFREVSKAALAAIDRNLANVPVEYIQDKLRAIGDSMLLATNSIITTCTTGPLPLPRELEITLPDTADASDPPTHVLAIDASTPADQTEPITLHPVHAIVLVAHCANLALPPEGARPLVLGAHSANLALPPAGARRLALPVHPLRLPSPRTFRLLLEYLYTGSTEPLFSSFLPLPMGTLLRHAYIKNIAETCTIHGLLECAYTVQGVWGNAGELGVFDETLWGVMDYAWGTLLEALEVKIGQQ